MKQNEVLRKNLKRKNTYRPVIIFVHNSYCRTYTRYFISLTVIFAALAGTGKSRIAITTNFGLGFS